MTDIKEEKQEFIKGDARKHFKEGQRNVTPIQGDATRGFYESLLEENPNSQMALRYCVENGLLSGLKLSEALKRYYKLKDSGAFNANKIAMDRILAREVKK
jgi:hypothetical protein